jgi:hypothetical protein
VTAIQLRRTPCGQLRRTHGRGSRIGSGRILFRISRNIRIRERERKPIALNEISARHDRWARATGECSGLGLGRSGAGSRCLIAGLESFSSGPRARGRNIKIQKIIGRSIGSVRWRIVQ